jgi:hypothetical protein
VQPVPGDVCTFQRFTFERSAHPPHQTRARFHFRFRARIQVRRQRQMAVATAGAEGSVRGSDRGMATSELFSVVTACRARA